MFTIPNFITALNLFSGVLATISAYNGEFSHAMYFVLLAAVFDFLDGFVARLLHSTSAIGKELDSLADVVSFGLAPAMVAFSLLKPLAAIFFGLPYLAFGIVIFSAFRLAKFNLDSRQTTSFIGLPTPANALFWTSLAATQNDFSTTQCLILLALVAVFCFLLICELPMFSLKFKHPLKENRIQILFLLASAILLALFGIAGFYLAIILYIALSVGVWIIRKKKEC